jgi:hypothetical protein
MYDSVDIRRMPLTKLVLCELGFDCRGQVDAGLECNGYEEMKYVGHFLSVAGFLLQLDSLVRKVLSRSFESLVDPGEPKLFVPQADFLGEAIEAWH